MSDFKFVENPLSKKWVILAPRRAKRPNENRGIEPVCPFCPGRESDEEEVYRVGGRKGDPNWKVRVVPNKFPFAPIHEVIIHSQDHHKGFDELPLVQTKLILEVFRDRFNEHKDRGQVYIFHNHGPMGGESLPHPHSQLVVIPHEVVLEIPVLRESDEEKDSLKTEHFSVFSPPECEWPDEVWVRPLKRGRLFGETTGEELSDLARLIYRLIQIMDIRHGNEFPFNFYIYPGGDWYLRLIPRSKIVGGFELGTRVFVNTQDPAETNAFLKAHFNQPDIEKIKKENRAWYRRGV